MHSKPGRGNIQRENSRFALQKSNKWLTVGLLLYRTPLWEKEQVEFLETELPTLVLYLRVMIPWTMTILLISSFFHYFLNKFCRNNWRNAHRPWGIRQRVLPENFGMIRERGSLLLWEENWSLWSSRLYFCCSNNFCCCSSRRVLIRNIFGILKST